MPREERTRGYDWDRSADHITSGPAARTAASIGRIHGCTRIVSRKGQILFPCTAGAVHTWHSRDETACPLSRRVLEGNRTPAARSQPRPLSRANVLRRCACHSFMARRSPSDRAVFGTIMALRIPVGVETAVAHDRKSSGFIRACQPQYRRRFLRDDTATLFDVAGQLAGGTRTWWDDFCLPLPWAFSLAPCTRLTHSYRANHPLRRQRLLLKSPVSIAAVCGVSERTWKAEVLLHEGLFPLGLPVR